MRTAGKLVALSALLICFSTTSAFDQSVNCGSPAGTKHAFGEYLRCIKERLDDDYESYENELREHNRKAVGACFASSLEDGNRKGRCVLTEKDLEQVAWDRHGPLRDCTICRTFASGAIKAIKSTPPEDQACIRSEISKAIQKEANYCLSRKVVNFPGVPDIPDIEAKSYEFRDTVINSISDYILIHSRLAFCSDRNARRGTDTGNCLANPFVGYLQQHCSALQRCTDALSSGGCQSAISQARVATCACIHDARDDLKRRIASILQSIKDVIDGNVRVAGTSTQVEACVAKIRGQMNTPSNDWVTVIDGALGRCIRNKPAGQNLGMDSLLQVGCRKVLADQTGTAGSQLKTGFDFVNNLIDAMVDRSGRFCGGEHCLA